MVLASEATVMTQVPIELAQEMGAQGKDIAHIVGVFDVGTASVS